MRSAVNKEPMPTVVARVGECARFDRCGVPSGGRAMSGEPTALELADRLDDVNRTADLGDDCDDWLSAAADMLRRQHGENEALRADIERLRRVIADGAAHAGTTCGAVAQCVDCGRQYQMRVTLRQIGRGTASNA